MSQRAMKAAHQQPEDFTTLFPLQWLLSFFQRLQTVVSKEPTLLEVLRALLCGKYIATA